MVKENVKSTVKQILTAYLESNQLRRTPERYAILDIAYSFNKPFTLKELDEKLDENNFRVSRATLYNTMKLFVKLRLIVKHRLGGASLYEACYASGSHTYQICTECGRVSEIKAAALQEAVKNTHLRRFHSDVFTIYIYGVCSTCVARQTRQKRKNEIVNIKNS